MTPTSSGESRRTASPIAILLIGVGLVIAATGLVDFTIVSLFPQLNQAVWRLNVMTQVVDRGIVPLLGFALVLWGFWIQACQGVRSSWRRTLLVPIFLLSGLLGVLYMGISVIYLSDNSQVKLENLQRIEQRANQAEAELDTRLSQEVNLINTLLSNQAQLSQLQSGNLTDTQQQQLNQLLAQLELFKNDPQALRERTAATRDQAISQIREQKEEAQKSVQDGANQAAARTPPSSLLLTIGYFFLAVLGLQHGSSRTA